MELVKSYYFDVKEFLPFASFLVSVFSAWVALNVKHLIVSTRFNKRVVTIIAALRMAQSKDILEATKENLEILIHTFETYYSFRERKFTTRVAKVYQEAIKQKQSSKPNTRVLEGLLLNLQNLHSEIKP